MNQMPLRQLTDGARLRLPTRRAAAKERTREELLASARRLFTEKGYERATIRDIASGAGKSTGAVFASFSDKSDLFNAIVLDNRNALYAAMCVVAHGVPGASQPVEAVLLELFDVANPNACYRRVESVVPNQALAMTNSLLSLNQARQLAAGLTAEVGGGADVATIEKFITAAFEQILSRPPAAAEQAACARFLREHATLVQQTEKTVFPSGAPGVQAAAADPAQRARENLIHVLFSHNDFVTIR